MKRHLEYRDEKSEKFWEIEVAGASHTVRYGRIGQTGRTSTKAFDTHEAALASAERLVAQKTKKGYVAASRDEAAAAAVIRQVRARLPLAGDAALEPGCSLSWDDEGVTPGLLHVPDRGLGMEFVRLFSDARSNEVVWIAAGDVRGVYYVPHDAGVFSVEEFEVDTEQIFEDVLDFTTPDEWVERSGSEKLELLEEEAEFGFLGTLEAVLDAVTIERFDVAADIEIDVAVRQLVPPGAVHGELLFSDGEALWGSAFGELYRIDTDGTVTAADDVPGGAFCTAVLDGVRYVAGNAIHRLGPDGTSEAVDIAEVESLPIASWDGTAFRAMTVHDGTVWAAGREGVIYRLDGDAFVCVDRLAKLDTINALLGGEDLLIAPHKGGLKTWVDGKPKGAKLRAGKLVDILITDSGALLVACTGKDNQPGCVYRRAPGEASFEQAFMPDDGVCLNLVQLPSGRIVAGGKWSAIFASDDDGVSFAEVEHEFLGVAGGRPSKRDFSGIAVLDDAAYLGGPFAPIVVVR